MLKPITAGMMLLLGSGCVGRPLRDAQAKAPPMPANSLEATVIAVTPGILSIHDGLRASRCDQERIDPEVGGGVADSLIGVAVDTVVNVVSAQLAKEKAARTAAWTATRGGVQLVPGRHYCLAVSRGVLTDQGSPDADAIALGGRVAFQGTPAFVMLADMNLVATTDGANVQVTPELLAYAQTAAPRRGSGKKDVTLVLGLAGGDTAGGAAATEGVRLSFGRLQIGRTYGQRLLSTIEATTTIKPAASYTVSALVTESEDPGLLVSAFAAAFDKNKDELSSALAKALRDALATKPAP